VIDPELALSASCMRGVAAAKTYCASEADREAADAAFRCRLLAFGDGSVQPACARAVGL
jgi:hypothetical protein